MDVAGSADTETIRLHLQRDYVLGSDHFRTATETSSTDTPHPPKSAAPAKPPRTEKVHYDPCIFQCPECGCTRDEGAAHTITSHGAQLALWSLTFTVSGEFTTNW